MKMMFHIRYIGRKEVNPCRAHSCAIILDILYNYNYILVANEAYLLWHLKYAVIIQLIDSSMH